MGKDILREERQNDDYKERLENLKKQLEIIKQSESQTINYKNTPSSKNLKTMDEYNDKNELNRKPVGKDGKKKKEGGCKCIIY